MKNKSDSQRRQEREAHLQERLKHSEAEFDTLFDAAVDAVIEIDGRGRIQRFNRSAENIFGYSAEEVFGENVRMLMPEPYRSEHDGYLENYQRTGEARIIGIGREAVGQRKDGSCFPMELSVGEVKIGGQPVYLGLVRDISKRRQSELEAQEMRERLAHVSRIGMLGEMATGLAHELNQPLTAISSYANASRNLLKRNEASARDELTDTLDKISSQAIRAAEIIHRLRRWIKRDEGRREVIEPAQLIRELLRFAELELRDFGLHIALDMAADLPCIMGDPVQIQQVLLNLVRNAADSVREVGGQDAIRISAEKTGGKLRIVVSDKGAGISTEAMEHIFEPFYTTKSEGLGMGLALSTSIVEAHEGKLRCENNPDGGASFILEFPIDSES